MFEIINNYNHKIIKFLKNIINNKKIRIENKLIICEGLKLLKEAINTKQKIEILLITDNYIQEIINNKYYNIKKIYLVNHKIIENISNTEKSQGILFAINSLDINKINNLNLNDDIILIDNLQDPGNLGTMLRTSLAFDIKNIILTNNTTDYTSPKVIRSTVGSIFKLKIYLSNDILYVIDFLKSNNYKIFSTYLNNNSICINKINFTNNKKVIIFGNESKGISKIIKDNSDFIIKIPIKNIDSLNVSVSCGIIMYLMKNGGI